MDTELKPTAVRPETRFEDFGVEKQAEGWDGWSAAYKKLLGDFCRELNRAGVPMPSALPLEEMKPRTLSMVEPPVEEWPLAALAQHHGLPTTFLDWTHKGWAAAYFAAASAAARIQRGEGDLAEHMEVWALRSGALPWDRRQDLLVEVASSTNANLQGQAGLFTRHVGEGTEALDQELLSRAAYRPEARPLFARVKVPVSAAGRVLYLLALEGITGASMFPGPDGVVRLLRERALWDRGLAGCV